MTLSLKMSLATLLPLITFFYPLPISSLFRVFTLVGWWIRGERNTWNMANWQCWSTPQSTQSAKFHFIFVGRLQKKEFNLVLLTGKSMYACVFFAHFIYRRSSFLLNVFPALPKHNFCSLEHSLLTQSTEWEEEEEEECDKQSNKDEANPYRVFFFIL